MSTVTISKTAYVNGFLLSLATTVAAYLLVTQHTLSHRTILIAIAALAITQFVVQMVCFLHIGTETKPRWKQLVFWFMIAVVAIVVTGSIWIMSNLNYHMQSPSQVNKYMNSQDGL